MGWGNGTYISVPPITLRDKLNTIIKTDYLKPNPIALHFKKVWPSMTKMGQNRKIKIQKSLRYQGTIRGNRPLSTRLQGCAQTICQ